MPGTRPRQTSPTSSADLSQLATSRYAQGWQARQRTSAILAYVLAVWTNRAADPTGRNVTAMSTNQEPDGATRVAYILGVPLAERHRAHGSPRFRLAFRQGPAPVEREAEAEGA